jgi:hypothetical protein
MHKSSIEAFLGLSTTFSLVLMCIWGMIREDRKQYLENIESPEMSNSFLVGGDKDGRAMRTCKICWALIEDQYRNEHLSLHKR